MPQTITAMEARTSKVTADCPFNGTHFDAQEMDHSEWMIQLRVRKLESSDGSIPKVLFDLESSAGGGFAAPVVHKTWQVVGPIVLTRPETEFKENVTKRECQLINQGAAGDEWRVNVRSASANVTVDYEVFLFT